MMKNNCQNENCTCNPCKCDPCNCKRKFSMKKISLLLVLIISIFTLTACSRSEENKTLPEGVIISEITVWDMTCMNCEFRIRNAVTDLEGVIDVEVSLRDETVTVTHEEELEIESIKEAIVAIGYTIP